MVKIEAKLLLYDNDSHSNSSCSEDDLIALASYSNMDLMLFPDVLKQAIYHKAPQCLANFTPLCDELASAFVSL